MKIIAFRGYKQSGKDTAANYLCQNGFTRVAFADPLKDMVAAEYGIERSHLDHPTLKEKPLEQYPVIPKDGFSLELSKMMYKEFRTLNGHPPMEYYIDPSGAFLGVLYDKAGGSIQQLYWTPRALCILKGSSNRTVTSNYWVTRLIEDIDTRSKFITNPKEQLFVISDLRYRSEIEQLRQVYGKDLITVNIDRFESSQSQDASELDLQGFKFDVTIENKGTLEEFYYKLDMEFLNG